jgi:hypothetical protein
MKKLGIYVMMLAMMAVVFVGCNKNEDDPIAPRITITPSPIVVDVENLADLSIDVSVIADEELNLVDVYIKHSAFPEPFSLTKVTEFAKGVKTWEKTFTVADLPGNLIPAMETPGDLTFHVDAKAGALESTKSAPIEIKLPPEIFTELEGPVTFQLVYTGQSQSDGRNINQTVGIKWSLNPTGTTSRFIVEPAGGNPFVMIDKGVHDAIPYKEVLKEQYDNASATVTQFEVNNPGFVQQYFISKVGNNYYLINMTAIKYEAGNNTANFSYKY